MDLLVRGWRERILMGRSFLYFCGLLIFMSFTDCGLERGGRWEMRWREDQVIE